MTYAKLEDKLNVIEKEISELKLMVMQQNAKKTKVSLRGALKGIKINDSDIKKAKKSLFKA